MRSKGGHLFEATGTAKKAGRVGKPKRPESRNDTKYRATGIYVMSNGWYDRNKLNARCNLCQ
jgi:hypothetical protein